MDILHNPLQNNIKKSTRRNFSAKKTSFTPLFMPIGPFPSLFLIFDGENLGHLAKKLYLCTALCENLVLTH